MPTQGSNINVTYLGQGQNPVNSQYLCVTDYNGAIDPYNSTDSIPCLPTRNKKNASHCYQSIITLFSVSSTISSHYSQYHQSFHHIIITSSRNFEYIEGPCPLNNHTQIMPGVYTLQLSHITIIESQSNRHQEVGQYSLITNKNHIMWGV